MGNFAKKNKKEFSAKLDFPGAKVKVELIFSQSPDGWSLRVLFKTTKMDDFNTGEIFLFQQLAWCI